MDTDTLYSRLRAWYDIHAVVVCAASFFFNMSLVLLIMTEKNRILRDYLKVILIICLCDVAFTLCDLFFHHITEISDGQMVFIVRSVFTHSTLNWKLLGCFLWLLGLINSTMMMPLVFVFRYYLIVRERMMPTRNIVIFVVIAFGNAVHQAVIWTWSIYRAKQAGVDSSHLFRTKMWSMAEAANSLKTPLDSGTVIYLLIVATFHDIIIYSIVIYCSVSIFRAMNSRDLYKMSPKTTEMQRQMNRMLVAQMFLPIICVMMPLTMMVSLGFLRIDAPGAGLLITGGFSWLPLLSPLTTITLVSNFRRRFLRWLLTPVPCARRIPYLRRLTVQSLTPSTSYQPTTAMRWPSHRSQNNNNVNKSHVTEM